VLDSYMKSFNAVPGAKHMRIQINMPHGHPPGWAPQEIGLFIDTYCRAGTPLPEPLVPVIEGDQLKVTLKASTKIKEAKLNYTTDVGLRSKRTWKSVPAAVTGTTITAPKPPADANTWYVEVTDERGAMVSTPVQFSSP
jgi:hypothetical protein